MTRKGMQSLAVSVAKALLALHQEGSSTFVA